MKNGAVGELAQRLGADRVVRPKGVLPQRADRLDASGPVRPYEFEVEVDRLNLDSTSHRNLAERAGGDPERIGDLIAATVRERGKMHNAETDSGGVLMGTVSAVGDRLSDPPPTGARIVTLGSLTLTPLRLDAVSGVDPDSPQVEVEGTAYVCDRAAWAPVPDDLPASSALEILDVCAAASHTRALVPRRGTVYVLGAGNAGKLVLAAARDAMEESTLVAIDSDPQTRDRVAALGLADHAVAADLRDPLAALEAVRAIGVPPADLTVVVVNCTGVEPTAILMTAEGGTVLFFSMATSFSAAALAADGIGSEVRMLVGSGYSPDHGAYALDLVRRSEALRQAFGLPVGEPA